MRDIMSMTEDERATERPYATAAPVDGHGNPIPAHRHPDTCCCWDCSIPGTLERAHTDAR